MLRQTIAFVRRIINVSHLLAKPVYYYPLCKRYVGYVVSARLRNAEALPFQEWLTCQFWVDCARDKRKLEKIHDKTLPQARTDWSRKYSGNYTYKYRKPYF